MLDSSIEKDSVAPMFALGEGEMVICVCVGTCHYHFYDDCVITVNNSVIRGFQRVKEGCARSLEGYLNVPL